MQVAFHKNGAIGNPRTFDRISAESAHAHDKRDVGLSRANGGQTTKVSIEGSVSRRTQRNRRCLHENRVAPTRTTIVVADQSSFDCSDWPCCADGYAGGPTREHQSSYTEVDLSGLQVHSG